MGPSECLPLQPGHLAIREAHPGIDLSLKLGLLAGLLAHLDLVQDQHTPLRLVLRILLPLVGDDLPANSPSSDRGIASCLLSIGHCRSGGGPQAGIGPLKHSSNGKRT